MLAGGQITVTRMLQGTTLQAIALHATALQGCRLHTLMLHGWALHGNSVQGCALHGLTLHGWALHGNKVQGCALHAKMLQGCALHGNTLQGWAVQAIALQPTHVWATILQPTHVCTTLQGWHRVPANVQAASQTPVLGKLHGITEGFPLQLREQPGPQGGCTWIISSRNLNAFICPPHESLPHADMGEEEVQGEEDRGPLPCPDHLTNRPG